LEKQCANGLVLWRRNANAADEHLGIVSHRRSARRRKRCNEASGGGYARVNYALGTTNWNAGTTPSNDAASIVTNKVAIVSPTSSGAWSSSSPMTFFGLWSLVTAGTFYGRGPVSPGQVISATGQFITIPIGSAQFTNNSS